MNDKFEKFTERARKVLSLAQDEAQRFNHNYIGTEHLLLGLVREGDGVAAKVLANLGVELQKVRSAVEFIIGRGDRAVTEEVGLTPRAKKVIELAVDEARRLNHHYIGTEHLLLGLVREGEGIAAGVLESLGVNLEKVRTQTIQVLSQSGTSVAPATSAPMRIGPNGSVGSNMVTLSGTFDPHAISRRGRTLQALVIASSLLLLAVGLAHSFEDFAYNEPAEFGQSVTVAGSLLAVAFAFQVAGIILASVRRIPGYGMTLATGLVWVTAVLLAHGRDMLATSPYREGAVSRVFEFGILGLGIILASLSLGALVEASSRRSWQGR